MATENQDNDKTKTAPSLTERGAARRRLTKVGVGAGIIATLESKSAMADMVCRAPSGSLSNGLAASHYKNGTAPACNGLGLDYWKGSSSWPVDRKCMFKDVFYAPPVTSCPTRSKTYSIGQCYKAGAYACATLEDMLNNQDFDKNYAGRELVLAYLNFRAGKIGFLELIDLQTMWSELLTTGRYSPTAGVYWGTFEVASYLNSIHAP